MDIKTIEELNELTAGSRPVVIDFWATWCGPCARFKPHFVAAGERSDAVFVTVDVDEAPDLQREFGVQSVPTVVAIKDGNRVHITARTAIPLLREVESL